MKRKNVFVSMGCGNMIKTLPFVSGKCRFFVFFVLLAGLGSCSSLQSEKENGLIRVSLSPRSPASLLTVNRTDTVFWKADTLAVVTWWDADSTLISQAVSLSTGWTIKRTATDQGYRLACLKKDPGFSFFIDFIIKDDVLTVQIPSSGIRESGEARLRKLRLLPCFGAASEGDPGYLVTSKGVGTLCYFKDKKPAEYDEPVYGTIGNCVMPLFGVVRGSGGMAAIVTGGQYDLGFHITTNKGTQHHYSIDPEFTLRSFVKENRLPEDLTVQYHFLAPEESNWAGVGKRYRQYNFDHRGVLPLKERAAGSPELAYSAGTLQVRLRLGVKPVPYEILEQTAENEPPVRVFLTFNRVCEIIDEFQRQGINQTEFCLVGWNTGGHDGRYPQVFPVEPALGGEAELRKTLTYGQSKGYQLVAHDDYYGAYRISEDWNEEYLRKKADGQLFKGGQWGGGQSYNMCLTRAYELFALRDMPKIRDLGFRGVHYSDVLSILGPRPCYDPRHPETRRQDAEAATRIMALAQKTFGGSQSEGSLDFVAPAMDRLLYVFSNETSLLKSPYSDVCVPLFPAVYHGVILYNLSHGTLNSLPGDTDYLKNIEYGGSPLAGFYGHFYVDTTKRKNWMGNRDYRYDSREGLREAVAGLRKVYDDYQELKHLQMEFIEAHHPLAEGVFETVYSNGQRVIVNYTGNPFLLPSGMVVNPLGFCLVKK